MSLYDDLKKIAEKNNQRMKTLVKASVISVGNDCIVRSPVGNPDLWLASDGQGGYVDFLSVRNVPDGYVGGSFRANWRFGSGAADTTTIESIDSNDSKSELVKGMAKFSLGDTVYFTNSQPYAQRLEYDGHSTQAPKGIVRPAVQLFKSTVKKEAAKIK